MGMGDGGLRPRPAPQPAQAAHQQPDPDRPDGDIAHRLQRGVRQVGHPLPRPVEDEDPRIDQRHRGGRLRQRRQHRQPHQPPQRHPPPHAIAADQHLAVPGPHRMKEPVGETDAQQRRDGPRLAALQRPQRAGHGVLELALARLRPGGDGVEPARRPQPRQRGKGQGERDQDPPLHVRRTSSAKRSPTGGKSTSSLAPVWPISSCSAASSCA